MSGEWMKTALVALSRRFRPDTYTLVDEVIVSNRGDNIKLEGIGSWRQLFLCMGVWTISIEFTRGNTVEYTDSKGQLIKILQQAMKHKESPFVYA